MTGGPLGRSPLGGRNWEGFSPDPFLSSVASYITVRAIQDQGVITSLKHFIGYEQETFRTAVSLFFLSVSRLASAAFVLFEFRTCLAPLLTFGISDHLRLGFRDGESTELFKRSDRYPATSMVRKISFRFLERDSVEPDVSFFSDKTMHETYLPSFAEAVRAGSGSVMCSYNSINGELSRGRSLWIVGQFD